MAVRHLILAVTGLVAACATPPITPPTTVPTATPLPTPVTTTYALDTTAWYAGLIIHFDAASSVLDEAGGAVAVDLRLENPGKELATLNVGVLLTAGGSAVEPIRGTVIPDIPAGSTVGTTLEFDVDGSFDVARAAIRVGRVTEHIVIVPLVAGSQVLTTLEPTPLSLAGAATAGTLTITITGANLGLRLPDGTTIAARADGHSQSVAVLEPGTAVPNLFARFEVPVPATGNYTLVVRDGSSRASIPFTIAEVAPGG